MVAGLSPSRLINVQVTLEPLPVALRNFGIPIFVDDTPGVIDTAERLRLYATIDEVLDDWSTNSGAYRAAAAFFSQEPQPNALYIATWARTATAGWLHGALLTPSQQTMTNFTAVTSGAMSGFIDGAPFTVSGLNLASQVNINGVAAALQTALAGLFTGVTVTWNAALGRFEVRSGTTGAASSIGYFTAPTASGFVNFTGLPANNDTVTINGTAVTFVTGTPTGNQVQIAGSVSAQALALAAFLNGSTDANIVPMGYFAVGSKVYTVADAPGTGGNAYTLAKSGTNIAVSGATLAGGSGTDCSAVFGLTQASQASAPITGVAAETALACAELLAAASNDWYAMMFVGTQPSDIDHLAIGEFIEAASPSRIYGVTTAKQITLDPLNATDVASLLKAANLSRSFVQYSSSSAVAICSLFGRQATVDFSANNTTINLMWKVEPGIVAETLTETQANALKGKNCNVFVNYSNGKAIIQWGVMANGDYIDERVGLDWFQNLVQTTLWNVLYESPTKIPQTNDGQQLLITPTKECCQASVNNGLVAPGKWTGPSIGAIRTGDMLPLGWYVFSDIYENQNPADRAARKAMPIQTLLKLAGAVDTVNVLVTVNR